MTKLLAFFATALIAYSASAATTITGFGTGDFVLTTSDFATTTQTATTLLLSGNGTSSAYGDVTNVTISPTTLSLQLTATVTTPTVSPLNNQGTFQIELFDTSGNGRIFTGTYADLVGDNTATLAFTSNEGAFNGIVDTLGFLTTSTPSDAVNITLDTLQVVPEPSTYALLASGLVCLAILRKRKSSVSA